MNNKIMINQLVFSDYKKKLMVSTNNLKGKSKSISTEQSISHPIEGYEQLYKKLERIVKKYEALAQRDINTMESMGESVIELDNTISNLIKQGS